MLTAMQSEEEAKFARQQRAFPAKRRLNTTVLMFNGDNDPMCAMFLAGGCAAAGIAFGCDYHGSSARGHWLFDTPRMCRKLNPGSEYVYLDPLMAGIDVSRLSGNYANTHVVIPINDVSRARQTLLAMSGLAGVPVWLTLSAPGGLVVSRAEPGSVLQLLESCISAGIKDVIPTGPAELGMVAAGIVLNEVMKGAAAADGGIVAFYSLHQSKRVQFHPGAEFRDLVAEIAARPAGGVSSLKDRRLEIVGAGALGNWGVLALTFEHPGLVRILDDDSIAIHNLNRQLLLVDGLGRPVSKAEVLSDAASRIDPQGRYEAVSQFVKEEADLRLRQNRPDALICLPDNDMARLICADAAREARVLFGTAGSSVLGAQIVVAQPDRACGRCQINSDGVDPGRSHSCGQQGEAVVSTNMVGAGLLISELREALSGRRSCNLRFVGDATTGNRLAKAVSDPPCVHLNASRKGE